MVGTPLFSTTILSYSSGRRVKYCTIVTNHDNIEIIDIKNAHIGNASGSPYGINGTFFYSGSSRPSGYALGDVYRIAADNGARVKARGEVNRLSASANGDCGTLGWFKSPINGKNYFCEDITEIYDLGTTISNIQWAIGGCNLYLNNAQMNKSTFDSLINEQFSDVTANEPVARSAIAYRPNNQNDIILVAAFGLDDSGNETRANGPTPWELREFLRNSFGTACEGIMLDGGGSTQIAYKSGGSRKCIQPEQRAVQIMITTPM